MTDQFVPSAPGEARPITGEPMAGEAGGATPLDDPRALTILTTEHWGLLTARSLVYNEAFARAGMFLALLSATLVVLGLISTATGFSDAFLVVAAMVLALDLFVGLASLGRISAASNEDIRYLQGMNRLRHAYHEMVPELDRYVIGSRYDDFGSVMSFYGPAEPSALGGVLHGLTTTPGMIGVICAGVAGGLLAVLVLLAAHEPVIAGLAGIGGFLASFILITIAAVRAFRRLRAALTPMFPRPSPEGSRD